MRLSYVFGLLAAFAALSPAAASADADGPYSCSGFGGMMGGWGGGMMGSTGGFWLGSIVTTILVWAVLVLLIAYLYKKVARK